jgi:hypothetical protein
LQSLLAPSAEMEHLLGLVVVARTWLDGITPRAALSLLIDRHLPGAILPGLALVPARFLRSPASGTGALGKKRCAWARLHLRQIGAGLPVRWGDSAKTTCASRILLGGAWGERLVAHRTSFCLAKPTLQPSHAPSLKRRNRLCRPSLGVVGSADDGLMGGRLRVKSGALHFKSALLHSRLCFAGLGLR